VHLWFEESRKRRFYGGVIPLLLYVELFVHGSMLCLSQASRNC
jgi:hypothetical protein